MPISSDTLFHYTKSIDNLRGILTHGLKPRYCPEELLPILSFDPNSIRRAFPMVCFCDIPLHQVSEFLNKYGKFGIGLSKEWGMRLGLNPVLYVHNKSSLSKHLKSFLKLITMGREGGRIFWEVDRYIKPIQSDLIIDHNDTTRIQQHKYYDEREWRYAPIFEDGETKHSPYLVFDPRKCKQELARIAQASEGIPEKYNLRFNINDVRYIFIQNDKLLMDTIELIDNLSSEQYSLNDKQILKSRITVLEQLMQDI